MNHDVRWKTPPSKPLLITQRSVTRSSSVRSKGINFNTVSPTPGAERFRNRGHSEPKTHNSPNQDAPQVPRNTVSFELELSSLIDRPLPLNQELRSLSLDDQLRLLALKEMAVVAINDSINNLKQKLSSTQDDLQQLRNVIQRSLYKELHLQRQTRKRNLGGANNTSHTPARDSFKTLQEQNNEGNSTIWANLTKPINFLQQLDSMIQNEMEKSLGGTTEQQLHKGQQHNGRKMLPHQKPHLHKEKEDDHSSEKLPVNFDRYLPPSHDSKYKTSEDMFQAVSSSLWSFVSEVKSNMMSTLAENQDAPPNHDVIDDDDESMISLTEDRDDSEDDLDKVDLSIYSSMRQSKKTG